MIEYNLPGTKEPEKSKNILKRILVEYYYLFCQQVTDYDHTGIKNKICGAPLPELDYNIQSA